jgi:hypothetical protein
MQKIWPYSFAFLNNVWLPLHPFLRNSLFLAEWHGKIYTEWEKHAKTAEQWFGGGAGRGGAGEKERDCTWGREATKSLNETRNFQNVTNSTDNCSL